MASPKNAIILFNMRKTHSEFTDSKVRYFEVHVSKVNKHNPDNREESEIEVYGPFVSRDIAILEVYGHWNKLKTEGYRVSFIDHYFEDKSCERFVITQNIFEGHDSSITSFVARLNSIWITDEFGKFRTKFSNCGSR